MLINIGEAVQYTYRISFIHVDNRTVIVPCHALAVTDKCSDENWVAEEV